uniref:hypothetical protein n=1 Tax=Paractinoplanes polyasparticus TaxID=2856853 RepID=UPI001C842EAD|nr:hypothetical protein [Actinoplanes polyasparticus]
MMRDLAVDEYGSLTGDAYGYDNLLASFDVPVVLKVDDNDYQGDSRLLLKDGERWGILTFGWGSCSGCDAYEACSGLADYVELRDQLWNDIHWEANAAALLAYIDGKDWSLEYGWYRDDAMRAFLEKAREWLAFYIATGQLPVEELGGTRPAIGR